MKLRHMLIGGLSLSLFALVACNTVEGLGQDVQSVGRTVEKAGD